MGDGAGERQRAERGTNREENLDENVGAAAVRLSAEELKRIDAAFPMGTTAGQRNAERAMAAVNR